MCDQSVQRCSQYSQKGIASLDVPIFAGFSVLQSEIVREPFEGEAIAELAGGMLYGEHALVPLCFRFGDGKLAKSIRARMLTQILRIHLRRQNSLACCACCSHE